MLNITESDIFQLQDRTKVFTNKISEILRKARNGSGLNTDITIMNRLLADSLQKLKKMYNETVILKALDDIEKGRIVLVKLSLELNIPKCLPFIRYKGDSDTKILVNVTPYLETTKDSLGEPVYSVSIQRLYPLIACAYLTLNSFSDRYVLPAKALHSSAYIWASMFNKVLSRTVALGTNRERYDAFMYFAMKFFCIYMMQVPEQVAEDVARAYLIKQGRKNFALVDEMNQKIYDQNRKIYLSFREFCLNLFDNSLTNLRGVATDSSAKQMNEAFFLNRFVDTFTYTALFALGSYPYFLFAVMNAALKTRVVNDLAFQDIITDKDYSVITLMNTILT